MAVRCFKPQPALHASFWFVFKRQNSEKLFFSHEKLVTNREYFAILKMGWHFHLIMDSFLLDLNLLWHTAAKEPSFYHAWSEAVVCHGLSCLARWLESVSEVFFMFCHYHLISSEIFLHVYYWEQCVFIVCNSAIQVLFCERQC